jgi:hypothetical protein
MASNDWQVDFEIIARGIWKRQEIHLKTSNKYENGGNSDVVISVVKRTKGSLFFPKTRRFPKV